MDDWVNSSEQSFWHGMKLAFADIKMWILMVMLFGIVASGSVTNFFPTVVEYVCPFKSRFKAQADSIPTGRSDTATLNRCV